MNTNDLSAHLNDPARLAALRNIALLDTPTEEAFDRFTTGSKLRQRTILFGIAYRC